MQHAIGIIFVLYCLGFGAILLGMGARRKSAGFTTRLSHYENEEGLELVERLADRRGVSVTALLRMLVREEARRVGFINGEPGTSKDTG